MKKYIYLLVFVLFFPILFHVFARDASVYAYMGTLLFDGKIPYIDGWDHKGISLYLINALGYLIGFKNYIGIRILEILLILFSFLSIYKTLAHHYSKKVAFMAVVAGLLSLKYFFDGGNLTEEYGALFVLIALSSILKQQRKTLDYMIIGFLFVINFTIRANLISFWVALFFSLLIYYVFIKKHWQEFIQIGLKIVLGIFVGVAFLTIYFLITNSFNEFYEAAFTYNFSYSKQSISSVLGFIISSTRMYEVSLLMLLVLLLSILSIVKKKATFITLLLIFWIPIELYFSNMSGKGFAHYYMMWVPVIVLSATYSIDYFKTEIISKEKRFVMLGIAAFLFFQIPIFNTVTSYKTILNLKKSNNELIADHINKTYKNKSILVWGNEAAIYNLTNKRATVTNFYQTLFKLNTPITRQMIIDFTEQIQQTPPELIIDVKTPSLLFLDISNTTDIDKEQQQNLKHFFKFIEENYSLKETVNGANFYIKNV